VTSERRLSVLVEVPHRPGALESVLRILSDFDVNLSHIESRPASEGAFDIFLDCETERGDPRVPPLLDALRQKTLRILVLDGREVPWFPRHVSELDRISTHTLEAGVELEADHPGFQDAAYRERRAAIDARARAYRHGHPLPVVEYEPREVETWRTIFERLHGLYERHACAEYLRALGTLERECGYAPGNIPQLRDVSLFLDTRTGFTLRPVPGLLSARDFLAGLAFRVFFSTQYIRHHSRPLYTPEPDVCHELLGHAPMFADAAFADLSQEIGLASLGASDPEIERLARCYWFSVEFGLVREGGRLKAYGAGLLSSFGELEYACAPAHPADTGRPRPELRDWDPAVAAEQDHPITDYQPLYFVADSLHAAKERMREHCEGLARPFHARLNAITRSIWVDRAIRRSRD
jgi:phenylalanine-4-hydroxylase